RQMRCLRCFKRALQPALVNRTVLPAFCLASWSLPPAARYPLVYTLFAFRYGYRVRPNVDHLGSFLGSNFLTFSDICQAANSSGFATFCDICRSPIRQIFRTFSDICEQLLSVFSSWR